MANSFDEIVSAALLLPPDSRATLAEHLLDSLGSGSQKEIDRLWADEAERRLQEVKEGAVETISGEEVMRKLRSRYR